jgi:hypothetical protein
MHTVRTSLRQQPAAWYRHPATWLAVATVPVTAAAASLVGGEGMAAGVFLGAAGVSAAAAMVLWVRERRAALNEMVTMIDASLAARLAHPLADADEDARQRDVLVELRDDARHGRSFRLTISRHRHAR